MHRRIITRLSAFVIAGFFFTACSSTPITGDTDAPGTAAGSGKTDLTEISVGVLPIAPTAALQLVIDKGIFAKHGLELKLQKGQGGAALLPAVSSRSIDFAIGNPLSVLVAASRGLDMRLIGGYGQIPDRPAAGTLVRPDSGIKSWADLEGKIVAVNTLNTQTDLAMRAMVDRNGGDSNAVKFTEIPFADMPPQLEQGHIDAMWVPEPFLSATLKSGAVMLGDRDPLTAIDEHAYPLAAFTSGALVDSDPELVGRFTDALIEGLDFVNENEELYRKGISDLTGMAPEVAESINVETFSGRLDASIIEKLSALAFEYKYIDRQPDLNTVIWTR